MEHPLHRSYRGQVICICNVEYFLKMAERGLQEEGDYLLLIDVMNGCPSEIVRNHI
jgi:hypothetical protein